MSEKIKEEIKYNTELLRFLLVALLSVAGFAINIGFSIENKYSYKYILLFSAIFLKFAIVFLIAKIHFSNHKKFKELC